MSLTESGNHPNGWDKIDRLWAWCLGQRVPNKEQLDTRGAWLIKKDLFACGGPLCVVSEEARKRYLTKLQHCDTTEVDLEDWQVELANEWSRTKQDANMGWVREVPLFPRTWTPCRFIPTDDLVWNLARIGDPMDKSVRYFAPSVDEPHFARRASWNQTGVNVSVVGFGIGVCVCVLVFAI